MRWDTEAIYFRGREEPLFGISALATALNRSPATIRAWERDGYLPGPTVRIGSRDPRGTRRLYTRAQIEGIILVAEEEGMGRNPTSRGRNPRFTERVRPLFEG